VRSTPGDAMDDFQRSDDADRDRLRRPGILVLVGSFLGTFIEGTLFFAAAGRLDLPRAWLFLAVSFVWMFGNVVLLAFANPELLNRRGEWKKKKDAKAWDRKLLLIFGVCGVYILPFVMGLDVGRYHWSNLGLWATILGVAIFSFGWILLTWAMLVNPHFEATVRIQMDRHHRVVTTGPYAVVRHPGYVGASLWALGSPLIVGSAFGLVPAGITVGLLVLRTYLEDKTLQAELPGYAEYAKQVHYRIVPGIW
jgi:protein-S-isoprenylcysteine O-methyltransferase Ste14